MFDVGVIRDQRWIVEDVSWEVGPGHHWVVLGSNGAGKSTVVTIAAGRLFPSRGEVSIAGQRLGSVHIADVLPSVGFVSADESALIPGYESVTDVILTAAHGIRGRWRETYDIADTQRARDLLLGVGLAELADRTFATLSDGERQRVLIARARMTDPEVLVLDEPSAGLDVAARERLLGDLEDIGRDSRGPATITVTHQLEEIPASTTHALLLRAGRVLAQGPVEQVLVNSLISETYGLPLRVSTHHGRWAVSRR